MNYFQFLCMILKKSVSISNFLRFIKRIDYITKQNNIFTLLFFNTSCIDGFK